MNLKTVGKPLISIIVITYNSAAYVVETLESIKAQGYEHIELLISDDFSTDLTVKICEEWLESNGDCFVNTQIIGAVKNSGIPGNCNKGLKAARGEWIKIIAGDDALFPDAIEKAVSFISKHKDARMFASSSCYFQDAFLQQNLVQVRDDSTKPFYKASPQRQYFLLLRSNYIHAGTVFLQRSLIHEVGGFVEKYNFLEDHPLWLKITKAGEKFYYMPEVTLKYRLHGSSVFSHTDTKKLFNDFYRKKRAFELDMIYPYLKWYEKLAFSYGFYVKYCFDLLNMNSNRKACSNLYSFLNAIAPNSVIHFLKGIKATKNRQS